MQDREGTSGHHEVALRSERRWEVERAHRNVGPHLGTEGAAPGLMGLVQGTDRRAGSRIAVAHVVQVAEVAEDDCYHASKDEEST